jgi:hypothetical protein
VLVATVVATSACYTLDAFQHLQAIGESPGIIVAADQRSGSITYDTKRRCRSRVSCGRHAPTDDSVQIVLSR